MPSKFGGIPVSDSPKKSKFGGVPVKAPTASAVAQDPFPNRRQVPVDELMLQEFGGTINSPETLDQLIQSSLTDARQRGNVAQSELDRASRISATRPLESAILGAQRVPVGLASILSIPILKALESGGAEGKALAASNRQLISGANRELSELSSVNPVSGALGEAVANVATIGPGGVVRNLAKGELVPAAKQLAVAAPLNVAIGTGIRELAGADTSSENVLNDALLGLLGGRTPGGSLPNLVASDVENSLQRALRESAEKNVSQALLRGGGTKQEKLMAERLAPQILERPISETFALTGKGLETKATAQKELAGEAIEAFGKLEGTTNPQRFVDAFEKLKTPYIVEGQIIDPDAIKRIEDLQGIFSQYGDSISDEGLRQIRRTFDQQIAESKGFLKDLNQGSALNLKKTAANEIRGLIADKNPDLAKINKQYNFWSNLEEVTSAANTRVRPQTGFTSKLASMIGFATGTDIGDATARAITGKLFFDAMRSPGWKLTSAKVKYKIADAVGAADPERIFNSLKSVEGFDPEQIVRTAGVEGVLSQEP